MSQSSPSDVSLTLEAYLEDQALLYEEHNTYCTQLGYDPFDALVESARLENNRYAREEGCWPRHPAGRRPNKERDHG